MTVYRNGTLLALREGRLALGFGVSLLRGVSTPMLAAAAGYDWLALDAEHGALSLPEITTLSVAALQVGVTPFVRMGQNALDEAARALDGGAQGVIVPSVDSAEQAQGVVDALRFPPRGRRNWGNVAVHFGFIPPPPEAARAELDAETAVVVMIETAAGVAAADAIAAVPGVDALFVGTVDLALDLGCAGDAGSPRLHDAVEVVAAAARRHHLPLGFGGVTDDEVAQRWIRSGARLVAGGNDQSFVLSAATAGARRLRACDAVEPSDHR